MAKRDKRRASLRCNPRNVRPDDLDVVLRAAGFTARQVGTSHKVYVRGRHQISVPQRKPFLLATYVEHALLVLDEIAEEEDDDSDA